ncbi:Ig-like domain-containing protein [Flavobacterium sp. Fl-77]|uniref:Ig-like domain-containing protein n=1 Tax=Flavobacterium flavipigmentatum TaxID=2893884 RepID=A0AAJ2VXS9_9FLAO|nr:MULTISPECIES: Ig-like domain-containing protein [unclassified Flavobacterium]MDX6183660.1 Ig-like domain-containing protein [Flavobacterium sp. Fl-33]MDX6187212.1 Ig-like domain-containing protein [Flavobacterium sp. Fl-77]UFH37978.1 Ig-like domain-containing protein [Flavobacterium sp. F-70]
MKIKILLLTFIVLCIASITGCENDDFKEVAGECPVVESTTPLQNALNVPLDQVISATFNEDMDPNSITSTSFIVSGMSPITGTVTYTGRTATFRPQALLEENTTYTAKITTKAKDVNGNFLQLEHVWVFSTGMLLRPVVTAADPINNAIGVALNKTISATFNMAMNAATLNSTTFKVNQGTNPVAGVISYTGSTVSFAPTNPLLANRIYTVTITAGAKNSIGTAMIADYSWSFTTDGVPTVTATDPMNNAINVALNQTVTADFSTLMDAASITTATFTLKQGTTTIPGTVSYSGNTASFNPTNALALGQIYTATITNGAKSASGTALTADYVWNFTTVLLPPAPIIVDLGTAAMFGSFGGNAGVTNQGLNTVINNGSLGTTAASTTITGFHDGLIIYTETPLNVGNVTGDIFTAPPAPGTATSLLIAEKALLDANTAYLSISPAAKPGGSDPNAGELGGLTLAPGVYKSASGTFKISNGNLTLDAQGDPNATWIFQTASGLTVGIAGPTGAKSVIMINNGQPKNVFWYVGSAATINSAGGGTMVGTIIANSGVTFSTAGNANQTVLNGRAISLVASVTMVNTTINVPN